MYIASSSPSLLTVLLLLLLLQALAQVHRQFDHFVHDELMRGDFLLFITILKTLAAIGPNADPVFRDECTSTVCQSLHPPPPPPPPPPPLLPAQLLFPS